MSASITPLLAERLDIPEDQAQSLLESMLKELRSHAQEGGVELSGLGTFEADEGTLTFIPSSSLRRRVNHQFEGLSPEDLAGPQPTDAPSLREVSDEDQAAESDAEEARPEDGTEEPEEAMSGSESVDSAKDPDDTKPEDDEPEEAPSAPPSADQAPDEDLSEEEESIPTLDPLEEEPESASEMDEAAGDEPEDVPVTDEATAEEPEEPVEEDHSTWPLGMIGGLVLVLLLGVAGWFVLGQPSPWSSTEQTPYASSDTGPTETTSSAQDTSAEGTTGETSAEGQPQRYAGVPPGDTAGATANATSGAGGWTIVVASRSSRTVAENVADGYEDGFASVAVVPGTVEGRTWYRVTMGRYNSEAAAEQALQTHADMLPPDAWTLQLDQ